MSDLTVPHDLPVPLAPGQRWTYRTRPGEETSTALILALDIAPDGRDIVGVALDHLRIPAPSAPDGCIETIGHLPVDGANVRASLLELLEEGVALPTDASGYRQWRAEYNQQGAGMFTLDLAELVRVMAQAMEPRPQNVFSESRFR